MYKQYNKDKPMIYKNSEIFLGEATVLRKQSNRNFLEV